MNQDTPGACPSTRERTQPVRLARQETSSSFNFSQIVQGGAFLRKKMAGYRKGTPEEVAPPKAAYFPGGYKGDFG